MRRIGKNPKSSLSSSSSSGSGGSGTVVNAGIGFSVGAGIFVLVLIATTGTLIGTLGPPSNGNRVTEIPLERAAIPFTCPTIEFSYLPGPKQSGGMCIAWYNATTLYYFKAVSGVGQMIALTYDETRTTVVHSSPNLFVVPYTGDSFLDCTYYASNNTFVTVSNDPKIFVFSPEGVELHSADMTLGGPASGYSTESTSLFYDESGQFFVDDTYGDIGFSSGYRPINVDTGVIGNTTFTTGQLSGVYPQRYTAMERNPIDGKVYGIADYIEWYSPPSIIGVLNTDTHMYESICVPALTGNKLVSISFDINGTAWIATGGQTASPYFPQSIYRFSGPLLPLNTTAPITFSLTCSDNVNDVIGSSVDRALISANVTGTGCFGSDIRIYSANQTSNFTIPSATEVVTKRIIKSNTMKRGAGQEAPCAISHQHVVDPNATVYDESYTNRKRGSYNLEVTGYSEPRWNFGGTLALDEDLDTPFAFLENGPPQSYNSAMFKIESFLPYPGTWHGLTVIQNTQNGGDRGTLTTVRIDTTFTGDCAVATTFDNQRFLRADNEANRYVFGWTVNSRSKLCMVVTGDTGLSSLDLFEFDFSGKSIEKLSFSIWGDYYNMCFNDANDSPSWSKCYVLERARFLNTALGMPRFVQITEHAIVTNGDKASADPLHQPGNNGPRGPVMSSFPCGIFATMTANNGGVIDLKLCSSIDFSTSSITTSDSLTTIGTYDDGSSGTCTSETECISLPGIVLDPNRYDIMTAYRHFPFLGGIEQVAVTITVNSNGAGNSAILVGRFNISTLGQLTGMVQTYDPTTADEWNPSPVFTPDAILWIGHRIFRASNNRLLWRYTRTLYGSMAFGPFQPSLDATPNSLEGNLLTTSSVQNNFYGSAIPGFNSTIFIARPIIQGDLVGAPHQYFQKPGGLLYSPNQRYARQFWAYDDCNQASTCISTVEYTSPSNYALPSSA